MSTSKNTESHVKVPDGWTRCQYYLLDKKRFCKQIINPKVPVHVTCPIYCGNHYHVYPSCPDEKDIYHRIPCPIDPSHFIYAGNVEKHIRICPKYLSAQKEKSQYYYRENINTGGWGPILYLPTKRARLYNDDSKNNLSLLRNCVDGLECSTYSRPKSNDEQVQWAHNLAKRALEIYQRLFLTENDEWRDIQSWLERKSHHNNNKQNHVYESIHTITLDQILHHSNIQLQNYNNTKDEEDIVAQMKYHRIKIGGSKHTKQIASIIGHVRRDWMTDTKLTPAVFEFGAGRATTGFMTACHLASHFSPPFPVPLVVIERHGSRAKADAAIRRLDSESGQEKLYQDSKHIVMTRIPCDVAHVHFPTLIQNLVDNYLKIATDDVIFHHSTSSKNVIVIAKHLCGAGTDLALKSLVSVKSRIHGCYLATCCHGLCTWEDYVGRQYLRDLFAFQEGTMTTNPLPRFDREEFLLLRRWSSSAVLDPNNKDASEVKEMHSVTGDLDAESSYVYSTASIIRNLQLSCGPQGFGRICQRLIDYGRMQFLKQNVFLQEESNSTCESHVDLCNYVFKDITPQNTLIKAWWTVQKP